MSVACSACGTKAPAGARFCLQCGSALVSTCPACQVELPAGSRFCSSCGQRLAYTPPPAPAAPSEERKLITVLFADLVGFTSHTERSDPEDVRARLSTYHRRVREDVERFGGRIEKLMGDGVFAVFGAPIAHEDDPERAVRSALRIQESVDRLNEEDPNLELSVRIGVTTGEAIVQLDESSVDREGIIGDVVNTASRLEGVAEPGTVVVDERTHRGSVGAVEFEEVPPVLVKGKDEPVPIWRASGVRSRMGVVLEDTHQTPFLGRDAELDLLVSTFDRTVREGQIQLVTIVGEPGVGKSRLLHEFRLVIDDRPDLVWWRQGRCIPYGEGITFWALGEIIKAQAGILDSDDPASVGHKLTTAIASLVDDPAASSWVRSQLEPLAGVGRADAQSSGNELFAALTRFFEALAMRNPLILVIEDLQWADPSLLEFVDHLTDWATDSPILLVGTSRPELLTAHPGWGGGKRNATTIGLSRLSDEDTARIIASLLDRTLLEAGVQRALLHRCGGNPLYATEFVRYAADRGLLDRLGEDIDLPMPDTVHGLIAARLDLLEHDDKTLLQAASVVGRVFWSEALAAATSTSIDEVRSRLRTLATREMIRPVRQASMGGHEEWTFTHSLITDVAYGQIPRSDRGRLHLAVTGWIESAARERIGEVAELLAHHYGKVFDLAPALVDSDVRSRAFRALTTAGERVAGLDGRRGAAYYDRAVALAPTPAERAMARIERVDLLADYTDLDEADQDLHLALADAREAADAELEARALYRLSGNRWYRGDSEGRRRHLDEAWSILADRPDSDLGAQVIMGQAFDAWVAGDSPNALDIIERGRHTVLAAGSLEVRARLLNIEGGARVTVGDESGLDMMRQSIEMLLDGNYTAQANSAYNNMATHAVFFRPATEVAALMDEAIAMCHERGYQPHAEFSTMTRVESLLPLGRWTQARRDLEGIIKADRARGGSRVASDAQGWLALFAYLTGDSTRARELFDPIASQAMETSDAQYVGGALTTGLLIAAALDDADGVALYANRLEATLTESGQYVDFYVGLVADDLIAFGRTDQLERLLEVARPRGIWGSARLLQGKSALASARGDHETAFDHAMESIALLEALDHVFDPTRSRIIAARALIAADRAAEAIPLLERALNDAEAMGCELLADQARRLMGGADAVAART